MKTYNWQQSDWPLFRYDLSGFEEILIEIATKSGLIQGKIAHLSKNLKTETLVDFVVEEAVKTSEIEGEYINRPDIRSSIKNALGLNPSPAKIHDQRAKGITEMMLEMRNKFNEPLSENKLFSWHALLFSNELNIEMQIGAWRTHVEPMQVISGHYGKWDIDFEAPPSHLVPHEMKQFINWFNLSTPGKTKAIIHAPVRAAIAHLYFESIHPFEDGNGRIGRAIAEKVLSQDAGYPVLLSLSQVIEAEKNEYYKALHQASVTNEITEWLNYFVRIILKAYCQAEIKINFVLKKSKFFDKYKDKLNERQLKVIQRMMKSDIKGFEGGMSAKKYMAITGTSKATATRDLQDLFNLKAFNQMGAGRSIRYELNFEDSENRM